MAQAKSGKGGQIVGWRMGPRWHVDLLRVGLNLRYDKLV